MSQKILVFHDFFLYHGGGERLSLIMREALSADLAAGFIAPWSMGEEWVRGNEQLQIIDDKWGGEFWTVGNDCVVPEGKRNGWMMNDESKVKVHILWKAWNRGLLRYLRLKWYYLTRTAFLRNYTHILFAGDCLEALWRAPKSARTIVYVHNIPRYLFSHREMYLAKARVWQRPFLWLFSEILRPVYIRSIRRASCVITNSQHLADSLRSLTGRGDIHVLYPCVDTSIFSPRSNPQWDGYFLSYARLATLKKVDRIIRSFYDLPDQKLLVVYGKNDPQKEEFLSLTKGYPNIECRTLENNDELPEIVRQARSHIFISENEEFGMNVIEASASGIPTIAAHDGGMLETIVEWKNGVFLSKDPTIQEIQDAVRMMTPEKALSLREGCIDEWERFSRSQFEVALRRLVLED